MSIIRSKPATVYYSPDGKRFMTLYGACRHTVKIWLIRKERREIMRDPERRKDQTNGKKGWEIQFLHVHENYNGEYEEYKAFPQIHDYEFKVAELAARLLKIERGERKLP